jgi:Predicted transcriptional regulators
MDKIPPELVKSLTELGLLESEAKIYVALVMMNSSDVKEIIDFLGMSKPNVYEGLRSLEERGLIVAVSERPIVYQAVVPEIGLEMLIDRHLQAKKDAEKHFITLPRNVREIHAENIWYIFSEKNLDYKVMDMIRNAKKSVIFAVSERYIPFLKPLSRKNLDLDVMVIADRPGVEEATKKMLGQRRANLHFINKSGLLKVVSITKAMEQEEYVPAFQSLFDVMNFDNVLLMVVDDVEMLYVPPFFGESTTAMNSQSKLMVQNMKIVYQAMLSYFSKQTDK